jgi:single-stranded-DNA-specific exonuclease
LKRKTTKKWEIASQVPSTLVSEYRGVHPLLAQLLYNRGITTQADVQSFLSPEPAALHDPYLMMGMEQAVARILIALDREERITVYGDFDVDGVTASATIVEVINALGGRAKSYIPNRVEEGYGVNLQAVEKIASEKVTLLITADCGVGSEEEIAYARQLGIDTIVTDHHQVTRDVPSALAVINSRQAACPYPCKSLAGVGVAFKLAQALLAKRAPQNGRTSQAMEEAVLDLVALGTVADLVPLLGENRTLTRMGLRALNATERPGLQEMCMLAGLRLGAIGPSTISFMLAPRLNSAGRLTDAAISYELLTTRSQDRARELAHYLEQTNADRQRITAEALAHAHQEIAQLGEDSNLYLLAGSEYPVGIVGLVAGKLVEEFYRPVLVVQLGDQHSRGSARSIAELNITEALASCEDLLVHYGGHAQAAGFTVSNNNIPALRDQLTALACEKLEGQNLQPVIHVDADLALRDVGWDLYSQIEQLAPFGLANPNPVFLSRKLRVLEHRLVGRDYPKHLRMRVHDGKRAWTALAFNRGDEAEALTPMIDLVYTLEPNEWNGNVSLDLHVRDWRPYEFP